ARRGFTPPRHKSARANIEGDPDHGTTPIMCGTSRHGCTRDARIMGTQRDIVPISMIGTVSSRVSPEQILNCETGDRAHSIAGVEITYCDNKLFILDDVWTDDGPGPASRVAFILNSFFQPRPRQQPAHGKP